MSRLVLMGGRERSIIVSPGLDLLAPSPPGQQGVLVVRDSMYITEMCYPSELRAAFYTDAVRAAGYPGANRILHLVLQAGCVSGAAAAAMQRCWADRDEFVDVAVDGVDLNATTDEPTPARYVAIIQDVSFACAAMLPPECLQRYGPAACMAAMRSGGLSPAAGQLFAAPAPDGGGEKVLVPVLVGVLGGVALLAAAVAAVLVLRRRRRRFRHDHHKLELVLATTHAACDEAGCQGETPRE
ncbi:hypothetical protein TSOC_006101 [Tetrabaena socialis]|uniref:Uncharacterized protein n=1 Tax=Tetrabaena socialis TaxID=47790 RepID=A0A2J8A4I6_9CHLO|nr:hypothetical protein TSOC_006101 [Tetrabaena socialis]|eukprot:PNH07429.1 hypothetical protein TSOC_006101 [Tetrabaena socialis]